MTYVFSLLWCGFGLVQLAVLSWKLAAHCLAYHAGSSVSKGQLNSVRNAGAALGWSSCQSCQLPRGWDVLVMAFEHVGG